MIEDIITCDRARIPVVWLVTHEDARAESEIAAYAHSAGSTLWVWSLTSDGGIPGWERGMTFPPKVKCPFDAGMAGQPHLAVKSFVKASTPEGDNEEASRLIAIFRDPHCFLNQEPSFLRALRDASRDLEGTESTIICISPTEKLPEDLRVDIPIIHPGLPTREQLREILDQQLTQFLETKALAEAPAGVVDPLTDACVGMTVREAANALAKSVVSSGKIDLPFIMQEKVKSISGTPGLTFIGEAARMADIGGMTGLKAWLIDRKDGFSQAAREFRLPMPKGVLTLGVPGCGKSLFAKAVADVLGFPLIQLNPPDIKAGLVGETESNFRLVKEKLTAIGNAVVWIDELEKCLPKAGDRNLDGGTSDALLQGILNWTQERKGGIYLVATANDVSALPPELLRKGRWDAIFFVDLPTQEEREEIFRIHLRKRGRELSDDSVRYLAKATDGYSGAEIEAGVVDGLWAAFGDGKRALRQEDIYDCMMLDIPLSKMMEDQVARLRAFAEKGARPASQKKAAQVQQATTIIPIRKIKMGKQGVEDGTPD